MCNCLGPVAPCLLFALDNRIHALEQTYGTLEKMFQTTPPEALVSYRVTSDVI